MYRSILLCLLLFYLPPAVSAAGRWKAGKNGELEWHEDVKGRKSAPNSKNSRKTIPFGLVKPYYFLNFDLSISNSDGYYNETYKLDLIYISRKNMLYNFKLYRIFNSEIDAVENEEDYPRGMAASALFGIPLSAKRRNHSISLGSMDIGLHLDLKRYDTGTMDHSAYYEGFYTAVKIRFGFRLLHGRYKLFHDNFLASVYIHSMIKIRRNNGEMEIPPGSTPVSSKSTSRDPGVVVGCLLQWYSFRFALEYGYCDGNELKIEMGVGFGL